MMIKLLAVRGALLTDIPRQQFVGAVDRMVGDAFEGVAQVGLGFEAVGFAVPVKA